MNTINFFSSSLVLLEIVFLDKKFLFRLHLPPSDRRRCHLEMRAFELPRGGGGGGGTQNESAFMGQINIIYSGASLLPFFFRSFGCV